MSALQSLATKLFRNSSTMSADGHHPLSRFELREGQWNLINGNDLHTILQSLDIDVPVDCRPGQISKVLPLTNLSGYPRPRGGSGQLYKALQERAQLQDRWQLPPNVHASTSLQTTREGRATIDLIVHRCFSHVGHPPCEIRFIIHDPIDRGPGRELDTRVTVIRDDNPGAGRTQRQCPSHSLPVSDAAIANLPTRRLEDADRRDDGSLSCDICMEDRTPGVDHATLLPCGHWFDTECITTWLRKCATCPSCRGAIE